MELLLEIMWLIKNQDGSCDTISFGRSYINHLDTAEGIMEEIEVDDKVILIFF